MIRCRDWECKRWGEGGGVREKDRERLGRANNGRFAVLACQGIVFLFAVASLAGSTVYVRPAVVSYTNFPMYTQQGYSYTKLTQGNTHKIPRSTIANIGRLTRELAREIVREIETFFITTWLTLASLFPSRSFHSIANYPVFFGNLHSSPSNASEPKPVVLLRSLRAISSVLFSVEKYNTSSFVSPLYFTIPCTLYSASFSCRLILQWSSSPFSIRSLLPGCRHRNWLTNTFCIIRAIYMNTYPQLLRCTVAV